MKKSFYILMLVLNVIISCQQKSPKTETSTTDVSVKDLISCQGVGEIKLSDSYQDLEKKFGKKALSQHSNTEAGSFTSVWEGEPRRVNILWEEKAQPFKKIKYIEVSNFDSPYKTAKGLRVGISLQDVVKINGGMPVSFLNFYSKENGGFIKSFNRGDIQKDNTCLGGILELVEKKNINVKEFERFQNQKEIQSFDRALERMVVALAGIKVYAGPDK